MSVVRSSADEVRASVVAFRRITDARLVVPALVGWACAYVVVTGAVAPRIAVIIAVGLCLAGLAALAWPRSRSCAWLAAASRVVVISGVGCLVIAAHIEALAPAREALDAESLAGGRIVETTGVVSSKVEPSANGGVRFRLAAETVTLGGERRAGGITVQVAAGGAQSAWGGHASTEAAVPQASIRPEGLDMGSRVRVRGTASVSEPGDAAAVRVFASDLEVTALPPPVFAGASALRDGFVALARELPGDGGHLLPGLSVGDTSLVSSGLDDAMKQSSLSHLTAVSGANCALVVGIAYALAAWCRARRGIRIATALASLAGFVVLVTPEASVIRAAAMATIALVALAFDRPGRGVTTLAGAIIVLLAIDPWLATSLGFALSAAATAALLVLARPLAQGLARWMPRGLALALAVPLSAQLVCGPLLVLIDPRVPILGVIANLLAAPGAPIATVVGLAACLLAGIPGVGSALAWVAWVPSVWIAAVANFFAGLPGGLVPWPEGLGGAALLAVAGAVVLVAVALPARTRPVVRVRAFAVALVLLVAGVGIGMLGVRGPLAPLAMPGEWSIAQCDVGQGDAVLLRSEGRVALIDTGPDDAPLAECLRVMSVDRIDLLVLTHFDHDHVGATGVLVGRVGTVLHGAPESTDDERLIARLVAGGAQPVAARSGLVGTLGGASWRVLWPRASSANPGAAFGAGNDGSVVLDVAPESDERMPRGLYLGDLSEAPQRALAGAGLGAGYDVVKVAHHGSADQSLELYAKVHPAVALIGVGAGNTYGHPRAEIITALQADGAVVVRSDRDGIATLERAPDDGANVLRIWRQRPPDG